MKRICICLLALLFTCSLIPVVNAEEPATTSVSSPALITSEDGVLMELVGETVETLPDGFTIVTTLYTEVVNDVTRAASTKTSYKTSKGYNDNGTAAWTFRLNGTFTYDGTNVACISTSYSRTIHDSSWSMTSVSTRKSGNVAYGDATFSNGSSTKSASLTITCSKTGVIS